MTPKHYVDFLITAPHDASMADIAICSRTLIRALHACFSEMPGTFAVAFPNLDARSINERFRVVRVFSGELGDFNHLIDFLKKGTAFNRLFKASFPETVPDGFTGSWRAYKRFRVHTRKVPLCRAKEISQLNEKGTAWVDMASTDNSHRFRLYIDYIDGAPSPDGKVNSYGLSLAKNPLYLPIIK